MQVMYQLGNGPFVACTVRAEDFAAHPAKSEALAKKKLRVNMYVIGFVICRLGDSFEPAVVLSYE